MAEVFTILLEDGRGFYRTGPKSTWIISIYIMLISLFWAGQPLFPNLHGAKLFSAHNQAFDWKQLMCSCIIMESFGSSIILALGGVIESYLLHTYPRRSSDVTIGVPILVTVLDVRTHVVVSYHQQVSLTHAHPWLSECIKNWKQ